MKDLLYPQLSQNHIHRAQKNVEQLMEIEAFRLNGFSLMLVTDVTDSLFWLQVYFGDKLAM